MNASHAAFQFSAIGRDGNWGRIASQLGLAGRCNLLGCAQGQFEKKLGAVVGDAMGLNRAAEQAGDQIVDITDIMDNGNCSGLPLHKTPNKTKC